MTEFLSDREGKFALKYIFDDSVKMESELKIAVVYYEELMLFVHRTSTVKARGLSNH